MNLEIRKQQQLLAWTQQARTEEHGQHLLVVTPRLALSQEACLCLAAGWDYNRLFLQSHISNMGKPTAFQIVHGGFALFRTGDSDIVDFACVVLNPGATRPPDMAAVIHRTAEMLRCSSPASL